MLFYDGAATIMPGRKPYAAVTTFVLDVLESADDVGNTSEAEAKAEDEGPYAVVETA